MDITLDSHVETELLHLHTSVAVVGGGPAGMSAALEASRFGLDVILVDDQAQLGGHLQWHVLPSSGEQPDYEVGQRLARRVREQPGIRYFTGATAFGLYEGHLLGVAQRDRMIRIRADRVIACAGGYEHPLVFQNNDLPGVFLGEGILRLVAMHGIRPGRKAVVVSNDERGLRVARELMAAGIEIAAVADARPIPDSPQAATLRDRGVEVLPAHTVLEAQGRERVENVTLVHLDPRGKPATGSEQVVPADLLVVAAGWEPNVALLAQNGCELHYRDDLGSFVADGLPEGTFAAGEIAGISRLEAVVRHGALVGLKAAVSLGAGTAADRAAAAVSFAEDHPSYGRRPIVGAVGSKSKQFVCLCEDVSTKDLRQAVAEGFDDIQTLKRYTTVTMGPCQGKMCHNASVELCAELTGKSAATTGTTTARPPAAAVTLGILAGPAHEPVRRTPLHHQHAGAGATWTDMGAWKRPLLYSSIEAECRAVHERVGIIDVSTLGKLDVKGADAAAFLEWIHPNRVANLKPGRIRYRLMLDDAGIILDDGTIARMDDHHFFVTTGTGVLEMVEQWLEWWLATGGRCVHVTNVTAALGAINVAGPSSRELLTRLTDADVSSQAVPYLATAHAKVAGVPALILRIGFVGELGYELHFPAEYGDYLWSTLLDAGKDLGIAPFGVEAQRVLRLEKLHIIPGHDTDALSNPFDANMSWAVKLEKQDFIGRAAMAALQSKPSRQRLVGFEMLDGSVPGEGEAVVAAGQPVGRVTSAKWSPFLKRSIGMAWVPPELAADGSRFSIRSGDREHVARVVLEPFYDPTGERLKS
jgi:sarcosine oxidase subunit alpha